MVTLRNAAVVALVVGSMATVISGSSAAAPKPTAGTKKQVVAKATESNKPAAKPASAPADKPAAPADDTSYNGPPVLNPESVFGTAAFGYAAAKAAPGVMAKLFCYCGCDLSDNHSALIDCFTSNHGMDCHICQEEAMMGLKMHRDGKTIAEIQKAVDEKYRKEYPFTEDSAAFKKYKSSRSYAREAAGPEPASSAAAVEPKLMPGKTAGSCCSGHDEKKK